MMKSRGRCCNGNPPSYRAREQLKRGQGALEYLMTYGWAILIIVIIGGALYALGVFNPASWTSSKRATGFASLQVKDWKLGSSGLTLVLGNKYGDDLIMSCVNATSGGVGSCSYCYVSGQSMSATGELTVPAGTSSCVGALTVGKPYTLDTQINFTSAGGVVHIDSGTITGKVE